MISVLLGSVIGLTAMQAGIDLPRKNFVACLRQAFDTALTQRVAVPDYGAFLNKTCEGQANNLMSGLVGFDVKNGIRRTQAAADAKAQVDDYVAMSSEKYESRVGTHKGTAASSAPPITPTPTPAVVPKP